MKSLKLLTVATLLLIFVFSAYSQRRVGGKVIEILDGKTAVVKMPNGSNLTVILQYIEVPEFDQPLNKTVKDHLQQLILDQIVEVNPRGIKNSKTVGQMTLNGVDISQQMIRDGAAWYAILERNGQNLSESSMYQSQEALARAEKRGVWADGNMIPAWEFRAAREAAAIQAEKDALEKIKREAIEARALAEISESPKSYRARQRELSNSDQIIWANPNIDFGDFPDEKGLIKSKFPGVENEVMMTGSSFYTMSDGKNKLEIESRVMYFGVIKGEEAIVMGFIARAENPKFQNSNGLTITADGKKMSLGKAIRKTKQQGKILEEMLMYKIDQDKLTTIAQAKNVKISLGDYTSEMPVKSHELVKNLTLAMIKK